MLRHFKTTSIFISLFLILLNSVAFAQYAIGKFTFVQGRVDVLRPPATRAVPVKIGDVVFVGDIVRAKSDSRAEITFSDGNIVRVAPGTRVEISEYMFEELKGKGILKLSRGKVQAIIQEKIAKRIKAFGEANRFEIHTPTAIAGVRGTNFVVSFLRNITSVLVLDGSVQTINPKFPDIVVTVKAGYITSVPFDQPPQLPRIATDAEKNMYKGDFSPGESGKRSESEETVISEITSEGRIEPGAGETGTETPSPVGTLTETPTTSTDILQPPPISETIGTDTTPPIITISGPPRLTNLKDAFFEVSADEIVTFTYLIDNTIVVTSPNTSGDTFTIPKLDDGEHIITITATDQAGNSSTTSYTWTVDTKPPRVITEPSSPTNLPTASFGFNEPVNYTYSLDGGESTSGKSSAILLSKLSEGKHTIIISSATDLAGNSMTEPYDYSWLHDYSPPEIISLKPVSASPNVSTTANVSIELESSEPDVTYSYSLNGGNWIVLTPSLIIPNVPEGSNIIEVQATDLATNKSPIEQLEFDLSRYSLTGDFYECIHEVYGEASGEVAGISNEDWGGWDITMNGSGGPLNPTWTVTAGGRSSDNIESNNNGYWLLIADGTTDYENQRLNGTSSFKYLSLDRLGYGEGIFSGTYNGNEYYEYTLQGVGSGSYTETPLAFGGNLNTGSFQWDQTFYSVGDGGLTGLMGIAENDGSPSFLSLGTYNTDYETNGLYNGALWGVDILGSSPDNGALLGITGGIVLDDSLEGRLLAIYIKDGETGYIYSNNVDGSLYPGIAMYELAGGVTTISMGTTSISPTELYWGSESLYTSMELGNITADLEGSINIKNLGLLQIDNNVQPRGMGIWWGNSISYYTEVNPPIPSSWTANAEGETYGIAFMEEGSYLDIVGYWGSQITGNQIDTGNKIVGKSVGYIADISTIPFTAISAGETIGTFNPNDYTWQAISAGVWIETNKFLEMTQSSEGIVKLQQLSIPCVEVGRANLSGTWSRNSDGIAVNMNDVIFFAPNTNARPGIWATNAVGGNYTGNPLGAVVPLSGNGLSANFNVQHWDIGNSKWLSTITDGQGSITGGGPSVQNLQFRGAAAGMINQGAGTFSGTGAGLAR